MAGSRASGEVSAGGLSDVGAHQLRAHRGAFPPLAPARRQSCSAKNSWARTAEILLGDEVEALTRTAMARALEGDGPALRLCLDRIIAPGASRSPAAAGPADIAAAMAAVTAAVAGGVITPGEEAEVAKVVYTYVRAIEASDFDRSSIGGSSRWKPPMRQTHDTRFARPAKAKAPRDLAEARHRWLLRARTALSALLRERSPPADTGRALTKNRGAS